MRWLCVAALVWIGSGAGLAECEAAELGMGFRVGEVTQESAIIWTRVTSSPHRVWNGYRNPKDGSGQKHEEVPIEHRDGAVPGATGEVRVMYASENMLNDRRSTDWVSVTPESDYAVKFLLDDLMPGQTYQVQVQLREAGQHVVDLTVKGSFSTPAATDSWQDVDFAVVTCQEYDDLDHDQGFNIYNAMKALDLEFFVSAGDNIYLDRPHFLGNTVELARHFWHRMNSLPRHIDFYSQVPGYWEVDDHDSYCNDCWPGMHNPKMDPLTFEQGMEIFREQNPIGENHYRTVRWGRGLQVWMLEGRLYRSPNTDQDGPDKTIWGQEQKEWLKRTLLESDASFKVIVSPTPIVGPDRSGKRDNHANEAFAFEGQEFKKFLADNNLWNVYVVCGDRHWQYMSVDPSTGVREFSVGAASDAHAGGAPEEQPKMQPFRRVAGGFLSVSVTKDGDRPQISFRHHDVEGNMVHEWTATGMELSQIAPTATAVVDDLD